MTEGGSAQARAGELWSRAAAERAKAAAALALAASLEAEAGAWAAGAAGERRVADALRRLPPDWRVLHDRLLRPHRDGRNLDHVVIGPGGVFVIDSKNWAGGTSVHDGDLWQHARRSASKGAELDRLSRFAGEMERALDVPVVPVIALAGRHGSRFRAQRVRGVEVVPSARLVRWLRGQPDGIDPTTVDLLSRRIAHTYPPASAADADVVRAGGGTPAAIRSGARATSPLAGRDARRSTAAARRRPTAGRRRRPSKASALVTLAALVTFSYLGPGMVARLLDRGQPGPGPGQGGSALAAPSSTGKVCHVLTRSTIQKVTGSRTVLEKPRSGDDVCTWWLARPRYATSAADLTVETGRRAEVIFAASGTTEARVDMVPGEVSAWVPQNTSLGGWTGKARANRSFLISLRFTYPDRATEKLRRASESAAEMKVTRLAQELAQSLAGLPST